jgi:hypothetical protein
VEPLVDRPPRWQAPVELDESPQLAHLPGS